MGHSLRRRGSLGFDRFWANEIVQEVASRFGRSVAEQAAELGVYADHSIVGVEQNDSLGSLVEEPVEPRGLGCQLLQGLDGAPLSSDKRGERSDALLQAVNHVVMLLHQAADFVGVMLLYCSSRGNDTSRS